MKRFHHYLLYVNLKRDQGYRFVATTTCPQDRFVIRFKTCVSRNVFDRDVAKKVEKSAGAKIKVAKAKGSFFPGFSYTYTEGLKSAPEPGVFLSRSH